MLNQNETQFQKYSLVFFDGVCNLCNSTIDWLILRDVGRQFLYSPIQGETAKKFLTSEEISKLNSIIVRTQEGQLLYESAAVFYLISQVETKFKVLKIFDFLPRKLSDWAYQLVAKSRYNIFGKSPYCRIPTPEEQKLFLP